MVWAKDEEFLRSIEADTGNTPQALKDKPALFGKSPSRPPSDVEFAVARCRAEENFRVGRLFDTFQRIDVLRHEEDERVRRRNEVLAMYYALDSCRQVSQVGAQPLTTADIVAYLDLAGITDPQRRMHCFETVKAMDIAYLNYQAEKTK